MLFISMVLMGLIFGFIGIGGAGITIALLTVGFGIPIHTALAVALSAMVFTTLSGAVSHFKEGEVIVKTGAIMGCGGIVGAFFGANFSNYLPSDTLGHMSAYIMLFSAVLLYMKVYHPEWMNKTFRARPDLLEGGKLYTYGIIAGMINGFISGAFGIGGGFYSDYPHGNFRCANPSVSWYVHDGNPAYCGFRRFRLFPQWSARFRYFPANPYRSDNRCILRRKADTPCTTSYSEILYGSGFHIRRFSHALILLRFLLKFQMQIKKVSGADLFTLLTLFLLSYRMLQITVTVSVASTSSGSMLSLKFEDSLS